MGDFDEAELEECLLKYVGTISCRPAAAAVDTPLAICSPPREQRHMCWHLRDSDERACAFIAGPAPNRWGNFTAAQQAGRRAAGAAVVPPLLPGPSATPTELAAATAARRAHPLYASVTLGLMTEIINSRQVLLRQPPLPSRRASALSTPCAARCPLIHSGNPMLPRPQAVHYRARHAGPDLRRLV